MEEQKFDQNFLCGLSIRAQNVCIANSLYDKKSLIAFINNGNSLYKLKNCGARTVKELLNQLSGEQFEINTNQENINQIVKATLDNDLKKQFLIDFFYSIIESQDVRTINAIRRICDSEKVDVLGFIRKAVLIDFDFYKVRSTGETTVSKLEKIKAEIIAKCNEILNQEIEEEDLVLIQISNALKLDLGNDEQLGKVLKSKSVNLIWFFDKYILNSPIFSNIERDIIINHFCQKRTQFSISSNEVLAKKYSLTSERIRQINNKLLSALPRRLGAIKMILDYSYEIKSKINGGEYWKISLQPIDESVELEILQNDLATMSMVIQSLLNEDYYVISHKDKLPGVIGGFNKDFYQEYKFLKVFYVINSSFIQKKRLIEYLIEYYFANVSMVESDYFINPTFIKLSNNEVVDFIGRIISENFRTNFVDKNFLIKRNTLKNLPEIVKDILEDNDSPMTIDEIFTEVNQLYPGKCKSSSALRSSLLRERKEIVYYRGFESSGASRYGLIEWEESKGLKAGSIKHLCYKYLLSKDEPVHSLELSRYIIQLRDTTQKSILRNIQADPDNRFIFYKGGFLGLKEKHYNETQLNKYVNLAPSQVLKICYFIKNHLYYDYYALAEKFSMEFSVFKIQIENIIVTKCEEGVLKVAGERVYYNSIEEDTILNSLFKNENFTIKGLNPYKCELGQKKILVRVGVSKSLEYNLSESNFEFNSYDYNYSNFKLFLLYNSSIKIYKAFFWLNDNDLPSALVNSNVLFNAFESYSINNFGETTHQISFSKDNSDKFIAILKVLLANQCKIKNLTWGETEIDYNLFKLSNKSKLESYSIIINLVKDNYDIELQLIEAKKIYHLLKTHTY